MATTTRNNLAPDFGYRDRNELIAELDSQLKRLISEYFDSIIQWILDAEGIEKSARQRAEADLWADCWVWFQGALLERMGPDPKPSQAALSATERLLFGISQKVVDQIPKVIQEVFLGETQEVGNRVEFEQLRPSLTIVARAIQDLTLQLPRQQLPSISKITPEVRDLLMGVLRKVEILRKKHWTTFGVAESPRDLSAIIVELEVQIARYNNQIWLPLNPLITAPLAEQDLKYYSRDEDAARTLAYHAVAGDGVVLISGYRGVGKSSLVNLMLDEYLPKCEKMQVEDPPWRTVPVRVTLAKTENVSGVLRLCVRSLYDALLSSKSPHASLLLEEEMQHLALAYVRASYKFGQQQRQNQVLSAEVQAEIQVKLAEVLSKLSAIPLPSFEGKLKRVWSRQVEQTIGLLDYDEDRAEEDITNLVELLARPRSVETVRRQSRWAWLKWRFRLTRPDSQTESSPSQAGPPLPEGPVRLKLIFVFDEIDKMDEETGQMPLVRQLKNLFLARNTVFLLLTSKKFYYRILDDKRQEDAVLSSYFSWMTMVPLFGSGDTERLIEKVVATDSLEERERELIRVLAQCLTYRSMGIPRDIVRELRGMQQWLHESLQAYLTDRTDQIAVIHIYAEIQKVLEAFDGPGTPAPQATETKEQEFDTESQSTSVVIAPERLWLNEARREQTRHGLYVVVEELIDRGFIEWNDKVLLDENSYLRTLHKDNFSLLTHDDFLDLMNQLGNDLPTIRLDLSGPLEKLRPYGQEQSSLQLFSRSEHIPDRLMGSRQRITVESVFYQLTGRRVTASSPAQSMASQDGTIEYTPEVLARMLAGEQGAYATRLGLNHLSMGAATHLPPEIAAQLYGIFLSNRDDQFRLNALQILGSPHFLQQAQDRSPIERLRAETNEQIIREIIRLMARASSNDADRHLATAILIELLPKIPEKWSSTTAQPSNEDPLAEILSVLAQVAPAQEDLLGTILQRLNKNVKISHRSANALFVFQDRSRESLLDLLIGRVESIPADLLERLVRRERDKVQLWTRMINKKADKLSQQVLTHILVRYATEEWTLLSDSILAWLNDRSWASSDAAILKGASLDQSPRLRHLLQQEATKRNLTLATTRLPKEDAPPTEPRETPPPTPLPTKYRSNRWLTAISVLVMLGVFFVIPVDVPANADIGARLLVRFLELVYLLLSFASIGSLVAWLSARSEDDRFLWLLGIAVLLAGGAVGVFLFLTRSIGHSVTIVGQLVLAAILVMTFVVPTAIANMTKHPVKS